MDCKHFFGQILKNRDGIPLYYNKGCLIGCDIRKCNTNCEKFESLDQNKSYENKRIDDR